MSKLLSMVFVFALLLGASTSAQSVAGDWDLSINGPEGVITATATLKQDGEKVTGSITSPQGTVELTGTVKGKTLNIALPDPGPSRRAGHQGERRSRRQRHERHHRLRHGHGGLHRQEEVV